MRSGDFVDQWVKKRCKPGVSVPGSPPCPSCQSQSPREVKQGHLQAGKRRKGQIGKLPMARENDDGLVVVDDAVDVSIFFFQSFDTRPRNRSSRHAGLSVLAPPLSHAETPSVVAGEHAAALCVTPFVFVPVRGPSSTPGLFLLTWSIDIPRLALGGLAVRLILTKADRFGSM